MSEQESLPEFSSLYKFKNSGLSLREEFKDYKRTQMKFLNGEKVVIDKFYFSLSKMDKEKEVAYILLTTVNSKEKWLVITSSTVIMSELKAVQEKGVETFTATICTDNRYYTFK